ncbi:MAG: hypothetical protein QXO12_03345 [Candidatus Pacearchaeota archaeon]
MKTKEIIRYIYLYLFSLIGLILIIIGLVRMIDLTLKTFIFKKADEIIIYPYNKLSLPTIEEKNISLDEKEKILKEQEENRLQQIEFEKKQKEIEKNKVASNSLALIIVGFPLFFYHWNLIKKEKNNVKD